MKISPLPSSGVPSIGPEGNLQPSRVDSIRSVRLMTNATPLPNQPPPSELPNSANNRPEEAVEAMQPLSPQLALLAKQRRALQVKERELANREKALQSPVTGSSAIDVARLKSEPLSVLLENGVTYDQLTEAILAGQGNSEVNGLKAELQSLKQSIDQKFNDREVAAEKQVLAQMRREADQLVTSDEFELVRETGSVPAAIRLIERVYREEGEVLDVQEALQLVESELFNDAQKMTRYKKIQSQLSPVTPPQAAPRQTGMRTLTNRDTASVPSSRMARAMAAFYGQPIRR